jgi:type I restriction enzyme S subunit
MIEDLKPYAEYKDSGLQWLGQVPGHWEVKRLKNWVSINECTLGEGTSQDFEFDYLDIGSVTTGRLIRRPSRMAFGSAPSRARRVLKPGDTIVSTVRTYLKAVFTVGSFKSPLVASTGFAVLSPRSDTTARCLGYVTESEAFTNQVTAESVGIAYPAISETRLGNIAVTLPPPVEQAAIVRFLDWANGRLERAIRAKRKVIALLNEQKQAIIHRAVTRGLDPSVPLKESGVPWLGEIPAHWALSPNRAFLRVRKILVGERHPSFTLLSLTKRGVIVRDLSEMRGKFSSDMGTSQEVRPGDLVFCLFDVPETPRTIGLSRQAGMITGAYTVMECAQPDVAAFLELFYIAMDDRKLLSPLYSGLRNTIPKERLLGAKTPIPPADEMVAILKAVEDRTASIDTTIYRLEGEIELLREYRTRLVADVVTGKLDVREAASRLPDEERLPDLPAADDEPDDLPIEEEDDA